MKEKKSISSERLQEFIIVIIGLLLAFVFSLTSPGRGIHLKLYDMFVRIKPKPAEWDKILFVDISDTSLDLVGRFPWPRQKIGEGIEVLKEFGADKILFDIEFIDPSLVEINVDNYTTITNSYTDSTFANLKDDLIIEPDREMLKSMLVDGDRNVYLACRGSDKSYKTSTSLSTDSWQQIAFFADSMFLPLRNPNLTNSIVVNKYLEYPVWPLYMGTAGMGFTIVSFDEEDGVLRRVDLFQIYDDYLIPQLTLPILMDELGVDRENIQIMPGRYINLPLTNGDNIRIPVNKDGQMLINWTNPWEKGAYGIHLEYHTLLQYNELKELVELQRQIAEEREFTDEEKAILEENIVLLQSTTEKLSLINDKIVIVGVTATSADDIGSVSIDPRTPMVITHANVMNTIYQRAFLRDAPWYFNWIIILALVITLLVLNIRIKSASLETLVSAIIIIFLFLLDYTFISLFGIVLNYGLTLTALLINFVALIIFKFILYDKQKNYIKSAFMSYLSPDVVQQVIENPNTLQLGGQRMEITAFFSDVQGFTSISESLSPEEIVQLLNEYLTAMSDILLKYGGTVDKYEGDAIVSFFGAPIPHPDHSARCCNAAIDMQTALDNLRTGWIEKGYPEIKARIGMNSGFAIIGNMGSQQRMNYTMMGDTVNLASRLEGANKAYGTYTMISEATYSKIKSKFVARKLDKLQVVGKSEPIIVYELVGRIGEVPEEKLSVLERFEKGRAEYEAHKWKEGEKLFRKIYDEAGDYPSKVYADRCKAFMEKPPTDDWNGVFVLKNK